jgi:acyl-CoA-binding protein
MLLSDYVSVSEHIFFVTVSNSLLNPPSSNQRAMDNKEFRKVSTDVQTRFKKIPNAAYSWPAELQKKLYGLYKQATVGDVDEFTQPSMFSLNLWEKGKWWAWHAQRGQEKDEAANEYVKLGKQVLQCLDEGGGDLSSLKL